MPSTSSPRVRVHALPRHDWRTRPGMLTSLPPVSNALPAHVAIVLSVGGCEAPRVTSALAALGVPTVGRAFDADAPRIIAAMRASLVVVACQPLQAFDADAIGLLSQQSAGQLLVVDCGMGDDGLAAALEAGADQAMRSLAEPSTVRATLTAILRRAGRTAESRAGGQQLVASVGALTVDDDTFEVRDGGQLVRLTPTEFRIVSYLAANAGQIRSHGQIMSAIHEHTMTNLESRPTVRAYVRRIRQKLASCDNQSVEIVSFRLKGYCIQSTAAPRD